MFLAHRCDHPNHTKKWREKKKKIGVIYRADALCLLWRRRARSCSRKHTLTVCVIMPWIPFFVGLNEPKLNRRRERESEGRQREQHQEKRFNKMLLYSFRTENRMETWKVCAARGRHSFTHDSYVALFSMPYVRPHNIVLYLVRAHTIFHIPFRNVLNV